MTSQAPVPGPAIEALLGHVADERDHPLEPLRQIVQRVRSAATHESCDMCAVPIAESHRHVVDTEERNLRCLCPQCYLLFNDDGAAGGRFRQVNHEVETLDSVTISPRSWDQLQVPVGLAFFFTNSSVGRTVAFYPGPAGATESLLPLESWEQLVATNPALAAVKPDVEAILVRRKGVDHGNGGGDGGGGGGGGANMAVDCYRVPIDLCYALVGKLRTSWVGFDGGSEARAEVDGFFADLEARARA